MRLKCRLCKYRSICLPEMESKLKYKQELEHMLAEQNEKINRLNNYIEQLKNMTK